MALLSYIDVNIVYVDKAVNVKIKQIKKAFHNKVGLLQIQISDLCEPCEHAPHGLVVEPLGAVDDDDVAAERLAEVLDGLRLARSRRALGRATLVQVKGRRECYVASAYMHMLQL